MLRQWQYLDNYEVRRSSSYSAPVAHAEELDLGLQDSNLSKRSMDQCLSVGLKKHTLLEYRT